MDAIIGYISSGTCVALSPVIDELKRLTIFATCGTPRVFEEKARKYVFRTMSHATADNVAALIMSKRSFRNSRLIPASIKTMPGDRTHGAISISPFSI